MDNELYRDFVLEIYQSVADMSRWPNILDRICDQFQARGCIIFEWQLVGNERQLVTPWFTSGYDPDILKDYLERNRSWEERDQDIYERQLLSFDGIEVISEDILYSDKATYFKRPHVKELSEYGIRHRTGSLLDKDNPFRARFSLQLSDGRGALNPEEQRDLTDLLAHVAKAMDVGRSVSPPALKQQAFHTLLDRLDVGICILDAADRVVQTNLEFDRQKEVYSTFQTTNDGVLRLHQFADHERFKQLTKDTLNHGKFGARPRKEAITVSTDGHPSVLCVEVVPVFRLEEFGTQPIDGSILISRDTTNAFRMDLELVSQVYTELTDAELAIIELICDGLTNAEIAKRRERSVQTVNSQVKSILSKSYVANRTQLVRMLGSFSI